MINDEAKRLAIVLKDEDISQKQFSKVAKIDQSRISRMVNGTAPVTLDIWKAAITNYGYSSEWCFKGKGPKKTKSDNKQTTLTELSLLRVDYAVLQKQLDLMSARMTAYEKEVSELREILTHQKTH